MNPNQHFGKLFDYPKIELEKIFLSLHETFSLVLGTELIFTLSAVVLKI